MLRPSNSVEILGYLSVDPRSFTANYLQGWVDTVQANGASAHQKHPFIVSGTPANVLIGYARAIQASASQSLIDLRGKLVSLPGNSYVEGKYVTPFPASDSPDRLNTVITNSVKLMGILAVDCCQQSVPSETKPVLDATMITVEIPGDEDTLTRDRLEKIQRLAVTTGHIHQVTLIDDAVNVVARSVDIKSPKTVYLEAFVMGHLHSSKGLLSVQAYYVSLYRVLEV